MVPPRLELLQNVFLNLLYAIWIFTPLYFLFNVVRLGFEYMFSQGSTNKTEALKERGRNIVLSLALIFGSYIAVVAVINFLQIKAPDEDCFKNGFQVGEQKIYFRFVFVTACPNQ